MLQQANVEFKGLNWKLFCLILVVESWWPDFLDYLDEAKNKSWTDIPDQQQFDEGYFWIHRLWHKMQRILLLSGKWWVPVSGQISSIRITGYCSRKKTFCHKIQLRWVRKSICPSKRPYECPSVGPSISNMY